MMTKGKAAVYYKYFNILSWYSHFDNVCFCVLEELEFIMWGRPFPFSFLLYIDKNILTSKLKKLLHTILSWDTIFIPTHLYKAQFNTQFLGNGLAELYSRYHIVRQFYTSGELFLCVPNMIPTLSATIFYMLYFPSRICLLPDFPAFCALSCSKFSWYRINT